MPPNTTRGCLTTSLSSYEPHPKLSGNRPTGRACISLRDNPQRRHHPRHKLKRRHNHDLAVCHVDRYRWALLHGSPVEVGDRKAQGVELRLYGVNQQIISAIQNNQFRGYMAKVYLLHYNPDTGVANTPDLLFQGRQNSDYKVTESRDHTSTDSGGTVTVSTRITGDVALMNRKVSTRANVPSNQDMLRRKSLTATDTFFSRVASLAGKDIYWGTGEPMRARNTPAGFSDPNDSELQQLGWS